MYMPNRPRYPFLNPYQPPTGFFSERPQASTVPSVAGFCSSALPSGTQSPFAFSLLCRSSIARSWYRSSVLPTTHTSAGGLAASSLYISYADDPLGVVSFQGDCLVPAPVSFLAVIFTAPFHARNGSKGPPTPAAPEPERRITLLSAGLPPLSLLPPSAAVLNRRSTPSLLHINGSMARPWRRFYADDFRIQLRSPGLSNLCQTRRVMKPGGARPNTAATD